MILDLPETLTALAPLIAALGAFIAAIVAALISWSNRRSTTDAKDAAASAARVAEEAKTQIILTKDGIHELGKAVDGRLTELLKLTEANARAAGLAQGRADERADTKRENGPKSENPKGGG